MVKLVKRSSSLLSDVTSYHNIVGALQYLTLTSLDISFDVNQACQHMCEPCEDHFQAVKRILRYIQCTLHYSLQLYFNSIMHLGHLNAD